MNFNPLIPELNVSDFKKSLSFYKKLGFKADYKRKNFAFLSFQNSQLMIEKSSNWKTGKLMHPFGRGINFQITVKDIRPILKSLKNYPLFRKPKDNHYKVKGKLVSCKEFLVQDPDGYLLRFAEDIK